MVRRLQRSLAPVVAGSALTLSISGLALAQQQPGFPQTGQRAAENAPSRLFDVVIVIDISGSTADPTGVDIDGDGVTGSASFADLQTASGRGGFLRRELEDSIFLAELLAVRRLISALDPETTRVGIVTFAGDPEAKTPPAVIERHLTRDHQAVLDTLTVVESRGPMGATHTAAGLAMAQSALLEAQARESLQGFEHVKQIVLLTDGVPTLPFGPGFDERNTQSVLDTADQLAAAGIRVHVYAIGPVALSDPKAAVELAARTSGYYTAVKEPGDIVSVIEQADLWAGCRPRGGV